MIRLAHRVPFFNIFGAGQKPARMEIETVLEITRPFREDNNFSTTNTNHDPNTIPIPRPHHRLILLLIARTIHNEKRMLAVIGMEITQKRS
jgi:hypothetical protein